MISESFAVNLISNSEPVQPRRIASLSAAIEFSGKAFFLKAPLCATTELSANLVVVILEEEQEHSKKGIAKK